MIGHRRFFPAVLLLILSCYCTATERQQSLRRPHNSIAATTNEETRKQRTLETDYYHYHNHNSHHHEKMKKKSSYLMSDYKSSNTETECSKQIQNHNDKCVMHCKTTTTYYEGDKVVETDIHTSVESCNHVEEEFGIDLNDSEEDTSWKGDSYWKGDSWPTTTTTTTTSSTASSSTSTTANTDTNNIPSIILNNCNGAGDCKSIETTFTDDNGSNASIFKIQARNNDIEIYGLTIHASTTTDNNPQTVVKVWERSGDYTGFTSSSNGWISVQDINVNGQGTGTPTVLPDFDTPIIIPAGSTKSINVFVENGIRYTNGLNNEETVYTQNEDIIIFEGIGQNAEFGGRTFSPRVWNGIVRYSVVAADTNPPTNRPTLPPVPDNGSEQTITVYEAEDYITTTDGVRFANNHLGYTGDGFADFGGQGTYMDFINVDGGSNGRCSLVANYAVGSAATRFTNILVNGQNTGKKLVFKSTSAWDSWDDTVPVEINCNSGTTNTITLIAETSSGGPNFNSLTVTTNLGEPSPINTNSPTSKPSSSPTRNPTKSPTNMPTKSPTKRVCIFYIQLSIYLDQLCS